MTQPGALYALPWRGRWHAGSNQVLILAGHCFESPVVFAVLQEPAYNHRAVLAGILDDLTRGHLDRTADDIDAGLLVGVMRGDRDRGQGAQGPRRRRIARHPCCREKLQERLAKLAGGVAVIRVGCKLTLLSGIIQLEAGALRLRIT